MRELTLSEIEVVSGAGFWSALAGCFGTAKIGLTVVYNAAVNGSAPAPFGQSFLTGTASGPTPGGVGGRYPISQMGQPASYSNVPGGQVVQQAYEAAAQ